jgi:nitric oxide reductase subunit B
VNRRLWWQPLAAVLLAGLAGVLFMGIRTYQDAPPLCNFVNENGKVIISRENILAGQEAFQKYALMDYGSMFGDGADRGPDFTADALHTVAAEMILRKQAESSSALAPSDQEVAAAVVQRELKQNNYDSKTNTVRVSNGTALAVTALEQHYADFFSGQARFAKIPGNDVTNLSYFFFWGAWVCSTNRPGCNYSYTHNWPYDPLAGNLPTGPTLFWSVLGCFAIALGLGIVLYARGRLQGASSLTPETIPPDENVLENTSLTPAQRATFKFFIAAILLFLLQVLSGALTIHDFIGLTRFAGIDLQQILPPTVTRSWHIQLSLFWISACWIGGSIFILPFMNKQEPAHQKCLTNLLFWTFFTMCIGTLVGCYMGPMGYLNQFWHLLGHQGWEFVELGRLWQVLLFACLVLWAVIVYRGIKPVIHGPDPAALPNWLFYSIVFIVVLFCSSFVATPATNFAIADFWRWCVIHMWVEAFFEVFTTALVAYFLVQMGLVTRQSAARVVYLATLLFLGSGILGISHNFYWNAKPVVTLAIGSVFSTLQVVPLLLLALDAWQLRNSSSAARKRNGGTFVHDSAFLFILGMNFWNFFGAGVLGFIINLPIVNYYEHGTYLTVNHGHAALMGVYGNLSIAAILFCCRFMVAPERWNSRLLNFAFWSINLGLMLMVVLDLFPAGLAQLAATCEQGLWYSRSEQFLQSNMFQTLTWMRAVGGYLFLLGGVIPLCWFICTSGMKSVSTTILQAASSGDERTAA